MKKVVDILTEIAEMFLSKKADKEKKKLKKARKLEKEYAASMVELYRQQKEQLDARQASLDAQEVANVHKTKELNEKLAEISKRDDRLEFEQAKIDSQLAERYKIRNEAEIKWFREWAKQNLNLDYVNEYNIGICGQSKSGKSDMINGYRGLRAFDKDAAPTDFNECTMDQTKYPDPTLTELVFWDCPGAGTTSHPMATYFFDKFLFAFDYLIFVFCEGVKEIETDLMKQAIAFNVPFAFVRNKANRDLEGKLHDDPSFQSLPKVEAIKRVIDKDKDIMRTKLTEAGITQTPPLFVINSWALTDENQTRFEESDLMKHVLDNVFTSRNSEVDEQSGSGI